jgi:hypothetical protein
MTSKTASHTVLYEKTTDQGVYHVEDHGAGYYAIYFKSNRQKKPRLVGNGGSLEKAKAGIELHAKYGTTRPDLQLDKPGPHRLAGDDEEEYAMVPKIAEVVKELRAIENEIEWPVASEDDYLEIRLQVTKKRWIVHYGDPGFDTDHHGHWGSGALSGREDADELKFIAEGLIGQVEDSIADAGDEPDEEDEEDSED